MDTPAAKAVTKRLRILMIATMMRDERRLQGPLHDAASGKTLDEHHLRCVSLEVRLWNSASEGVDGPPVVTS